MAVLDFGLAVHPRDVIGDERHRSGTIQRDHGDDIIQRLGLHLHEITSHPRAFHLEDACGVSAAHELKGFGIVQRDVIQIELDPVTFLDHVAGLRHHAQRDETEEVHLEHS